MKVLLISGPVAVGKTSIATALVESRGFYRIRSGSYLLNMARRLERDQSRRGLQDLGDELDADTNHRWIIDEVARPTITSHPEIKHWLLDCVRKARQIEHFKSEFGSDVCHVHLFAREEVLRWRYEDRVSLSGEYLGNTPYEDAIAHPNEVQSRSLIDIADYAIDVGSRSEEDVAAQICEKLTGG